MKERFWIWIIVAWLSLLSPIAGSCEPLPDLAGEWLSFSVSQGKDTAVKGVIHFPSGRTATLSQCSFLGHMEAIFTH